MAIQYYMRGYNVSAPGTVGYVDWVVNDAPDSTAAFIQAPFLSANIQNIVVNKVVGSKIDNFLQPDEGYITSDGYFFHLNSFDWLHASVPSATVIPVPSAYVGLAVTRGGTTNSVGQLVAGASTNFFATMLWDEPEQRWKFIKNTNGDHTTLGAYLPFGSGSIVVDGYVAIGNSPTLLNMPTTGSLRLQNNQWVTARKLGNTDGYLVRMDTSDRVQLGNSVESPFVYVPGSLRVDGYIRDGSTFPSLTGFIRNGNNTSGGIITARDSGNANDFPLVSLNGTNNLVIGNAVATFGNVLYNTATNLVHQFQVNTVPLVEIGTSASAPNNFIRFVTATALPTIFQVDNVTASSAGQTLTLQAQNATGATSTGGLLRLTSGTGTTVAGNIALQTGAATKLLIAPTIITQENSTYAFGGTADIVSVTTPRFMQNDKTTVSGVGEPLTIQAQNETGATSTGGALNLTSGTGTSVIGNVNVQTGGTNQIIVSPTFITPGTITPTSGSVIIRGSLEVVGTTTTIDSTVVDIIGRVIHADWTDPGVSPNTATPTQITGYSIHRGNASGIPRDGAALIWTEGVLGSGADGYWKHVTIPGDGIGTDNFTIANSLNAIGTMASEFSASSDPNPISGSLAATGSFRTFNNVPTVVGRNTNASTTLTATGLTNGSASLSGIGTLTVTSTTGFTTSGTLLVKSSTGDQTVTYTGITGTSFTGVVGGSGTIITGGIVGQTNNSTTFNGSNGTSLPFAGTLTVVSTVGFPPTGTLRVISRTSNSATAPVSVQNIPYTATGPTSFTITSAGAGFLYVGDAITSLPSSGNADLILLGTDYGNRILHGSPNSNTGHIFNTPSTFFYDFQVNSVTQVQLGQADIDASGFAETIAIGSTVNNPRLLQTTLPNTGATSGFNLGVFAQAGQQQTGVTANNNGGQLFLVSGAQGTGGSGAAGIDGYVELRTGLTSKVRVFPTLALSAADNNSILYFENLFRVDTAQVTPRFRQDDKTTNAGTGETYTIQAQNETGTTSTGGALTLTSGTGTSTHGNVNIQTGAGTRVLVTTSFTAFNDSTATEALRIIPVSSGTTQITYAATDTAAQINQTQTASTPSATMTIQSQVTTAISGQGGNLVLIGGNATGTTSTGGNVNLTSGSGTTTNGIVNILIGGTQAIAFNNVDSDASGFAEVMTIASTIITPRIFQASTASPSGTILALMAQNAVTTGGPLQLHSGTGATNDGYINLTTGNTVKMTIYSTTAVVAANNNSILFFENKLRFDTAQTTPLIRQDDKTTASGIGEPLTLQAQNETGTTSTGGNLNLTSGTGTLIDGYINLQAGGVTQAIVVPNKFVYNKGRRRHVTNVTSTYPIVVSDDYIAITTLSAPFTITLPSNPVNGDEYVVKDTTGNAAVSNVTVSGNGNNIDGASTFLLSQPYAGATFTFAGAQWSVI